MALPYQSNLVELAVGQTIGLGTAVGVSFDGNHAFSITLWIRLKAQASPATVFAKGDEFQLVINGQTLAAQIAGQISPVTASVPLTLYQWHYVAVVGALSGGGGTITLYIDGAQVGQATMSGVGAPATSAAFQLGGNLTAELMSAAFFASSLAPADCVQQWTSPPAGDQLVAMFDFTCSPPIDTTPSNNQVTLNGASQASVTSAAALSAGWVTPSKDDKLDPGGAASEPFTVQAWVNVQPPVLDPVPQTIVANGAVGETGAFALTYQYAPSTALFTLAAQLAGTTATASATVAAATWHNVAVSFDGTTLTLYLDAQVAATATPTPVALARPRLSIGAQYVSPGSDGVGNFLGGYLQALSIWSVARTAAEIASEMTAAAGGTRTDCVAYYDLSSADPSNLISGHHAMLHELARITEVYSPAIPVAPSAIARARPARTTLHALHAMAQRLDIPARRPRGTVLDRHFDRWIADYERLLAPLPDELARRLRSRFAENLYRGAELQRQSSAPLPGTVRFAREGDDWVFYGQLEDGRVEVDRVPVRQLSECNAWVVSVIATALQLLLSVIGFALGAAALKRATQSIRSQLGQQSASTWEALKQAIPSTEVGTSAPIKIVQSMSLFVSMFAVVSEALSEMSWWDWALSVGTAVVTIVGMWVTSGWYLVVLLGEIALGIANLVQVINDKPASCSG